MTHVDKFLCTLLLTRLVETPPKWNFPIERHDNNARKLCENSARRRELPRLLRIWIPSLAPGSLARFLRPTKFSAEIDFGSTHSNALSRHVRNLYTIRRPQIQDRLRGKTKNEVWVNAIRYAVLNYNGAIGLRTVKRTLPSPYLQIVFVFFHLNVR